LVSNDAAKLVDGQAQYSALTTPEGTVVDDLLVYRFAEDCLILVVNASTTEKDWDWIIGYNTNKAEMHNISDKTRLLPIQGPNATKILQPLTDSDILNYK
jgi:aminomethyltransferase